MRIALSSYRSKPHSGGQGIYVRNLSRELVALGHEVTVFSGQPYPELDAGVRLVKVSSLDLYTDDDPFRHPARSEFRDRIDALEYATMLTGAFPEPRTFGLRLERELTSRAGDFDVLHDNQTLAPSLLRIAKTLPVVTTIHHPISADRRLEIDAATTRRERLSKRRWYSFVRMQAKVARASRRIITVSRVSRDDIVTEFGVEPTRIDIVPVGVDVDVYTPQASADARQTSYDVSSAAAPAAPTVPSDTNGTTAHTVRGRLTTITSANVPLKGLSVLLDALPQLPADAWSELVVVGTPNRDAQAQIERHGLAEKVRFVSGISDAELAGLLASAGLHVVPSLYEGFSLPAVEAMACGTPLVATNVGALPQLIHGEHDGLAEAGTLVDPGDASALADAITSLLAAPDTRAAMGRAGRARAVQTYSWRAVAEATAAVYREEIARC